MTSVGLLRMKAYVFLEGVQLRVALGSSVKLGARSRYLNLRIHVTKRFLPMTMWSWPAPRGRAGGRLRFIVGHGVFPPTIG